MASAHRPIPGAKYWLVHWRTLLCRWLYLSGDVYDGVCQDTHELCCPLSLYSVVVMGRVSATPTSASPGNIKYCTPYPWYAAGTPQCHGGSPSAPERAD